MMFSFKNRFRNVADAFNPLSISAIAQTYLSNAVLVVLARKKDRRCFVVSGPVYWTTGHRVKQRTE